MPHRYAAVGPDPWLRTHQNYRELNVLLQQAVRLVDNTELWAANETLEEATTIFAGFQDGGRQSLK